MGNESGYENISMFDKQEEFSANVSQKLEVVKLNYDHVERMTWEELFTGYDTLKAITFSSGINFVYRLLNLYSSYYHSPIASDCTTSQAALSIAACRAISATC